MTTLPLEENTVFDAYQSGKLLKLIHDTCISSEKNNLIEILIKLHNSKKIDVIENFKRLDTSDKEIVFFFTIHILEKTLPKLDAPILSVMECVNYLFQSVREDLAAGTIIDSFTKFCAVNIERSQESLKYIIKDNCFIDLLPAVLIACAQIDIESYLNQAIQLTEHENIDIRRQAISGLVSGLGRIDYSDNLNSIEKTLNCIASSISKESDDILLANAIDACFSILQKDSSKVAEVSKYIDLALSKGEENSLHSFSRLLFIYHININIELLNSFLSALLKVEPKNGNTLHNISLALRALLNSDKQDNAVEFLEKFLLSRKNSFPKRFLEEISETLFSNKQLLNRLTTRWFLIGERILCERIKEAFIHKKDFSLSVEPSEIDIKNSSYLIFLARKAIGYLLLTNPIVATNFIISLIEHAQDDETRQKLGELLFNPLLLNYTGNVRNHLLDISKQHKEVCIVKIIDDTLGRIDKYLSDLNSIANIPELHPSQEQQEIFQRRMNSILQEAQQKGYENSLAAQICSEQTILYGGKTSNYIKGFDEKFYHTEIELQLHSFRFEQARFINLNLFELHYSPRITKRV